MTTGDGSETRREPPHSLRVGDRIYANVHLRPDLLKEAGWLPVTDDRPEHDDAERLVFDRYEVSEDSVTRVFRVEPIPEPTPDDAYEAKIQAELRAIAIERLAARGVREPE
jgi:hypothetical protein